MTTVKETQGSKPASLREKFSSIVGKVSTVFAVVGGVLTIVMAIHVTGDVAGRNFFNAPIQGTIEYITYWWMPMIIFLSLPFVEKKRAQITVTLVTDGLSGTARDRAAAITQLVSIIAVIFILYLAFLSFSDSFSIGQTAPGGVPLPVWVGKGVMVLGLVQLLLQMIATGPASAPVNPVDAELALVEDLNHDPAIQGATRSD